MKRLLLLALIVLTTISSVLGGFDLETFYVDSDNFAGTTYNNTRWIEFTPNTSTLIQQSGYLRLGTQPPNPATSGTTVTNTMSGLVYGSKNFRDGIEFYNITLNASISCYRETASAGGNSKLMLVADDSQWNVTIDELDCGSGDNLYTRNLYNIIIESGDNNASIYRNGTYWKSLDIIQLDQIYLAGWYSSTQANVWTGSAGVIRTGNAYTYFYNYSVNRDSLIYNPTPYSYFQFNEIVSGFTPNNVSYNYTPTPDGELTGSPTLVPAIYDDGLSFNGLSSYVDLGDGYSDFCSNRGCSIESYFKTNATGNEQVIVGKYSLSGDKNIILYLDNNIVRLQVHNSNSEYCNVVSTPISDNEWTHIVATWDNIAKTCRMYQDGVDIGTQSVSFSISEWASSENMYIGSTDESSPTYFFNGTIDYVRMYDRPLRTNEVTQSYLSGENLSENYLTINFRDEKSNAYITENISITIIGDDFYQQSYTQNGKFSSDPMSAGIYSIDVYSPSYPLRSYIIEIESESVEMTALLLNINQSQQVKFNVRDSSTNAMRNALVEISKLVVVGIESEYVPILSRYTDYLGVVSTILDIDTTYRIRISKDDYITIQDIQGVYTPFDYYYTLYEESLITYPYMQDISTIFAPTNQTIQYNPDNNTFGWYVYAPNENLEYIGIKGKEIISYGNNSNVTAQTYVSINIEGYVNHTMSIEYIIKKVDLPEHRFNRTYYIVDYDETSENYLIGQLKNLKPELTNVELAGLSIFFSMLIVLLFVTIGTPGMFLPIIYLFGLTFFALAEWIGWTFLGVWGIIIIFGYVFMAGSTR